MQGTKGTRTRQQPNEPVEPVEALKRKVWQKWSTATKKQEKASSPQEDGNRARALSGRLGRKQKDLAPMAGEIGSSRGDVEQDYCREHEAVGWGGVRGCIWGGILALLGRRRDRRRTCKLAWTCALCLWRGDAGGFRWKVISLVRLMMSSETKRLRSAPSVVFCFVSFSVALKSVIKWKLEFHARQSNGHLCIACSSLRWIRSANTSPPFSRVINVHDMTATAMPINIGDSACSSPTNRQKQCIAASRGWRQTRVSWPPSLP